MLVSSAIGRSSSSGLHNYPMRTTWWPISSTSLTFPTPYWTLSMQSGPRRYEHHMLLAAQALQYLRMAQLGKRARLDLAHALPRDAELAAHLLQREGVAIAQPEAQLQDQPLARRQHILQNLLDLLLHRAGGRGLLRRCARLVGQHVAQLLLLVLTDG